MKNKVIYLFILIFSVSLISSAKKIQGTCNRNSVCAEVKKCNEIKQADADDEGEKTFPSLGLLIFNL